MNRQNNHDGAPLELKRDVSTERIGKDVAESGEIKKVIKREYDMDGVLVNETIIEYARLGCGHVSPASGGGLCLCGRSFCRTCLDAAGVNCAVCGRLVMPCCAVSSCLDPDRVLCRKCSPFGFFNWILRG